MEGAEEEGRFGGAAVKVDECRNVKGDNLLNTPTRMVSINDENDQTDDQTDPPDEVELAMRESAKLAQRFHEQKNKRIKEVERKHGSNLIAYRVSEMQIGIDPRQFQPKWWLSSRLIELFGRALEFKSNGLLKVYSDVVFDPHEERINPDALSGSGAQVHFMFFPVNHRDTHWTIFIVDVPNGSIIHLDSLKSCTNSNRVNGLASLLRNKLVELLHNDKLLLELEMPECQQQIGGTQIVVSLYVSLCIFT